MDDGHCGLPTDELLSLAERLLELQVELVRTALDLELADGAVVADSVRESSSARGNLCLLGRLAQGGMQHCRSAVGASSGLTSLDPDLTLFTLLESGLRAG